MENLIKITSKESVAKKRADVPFVEGAWVDFYLDVTAAEQQSLNEVDDQEDLGYGLLVALIADWNFSDEQGEKLLITRESVDLLSSKLKVWLMQEATSIIKQPEVRKKELPAS